jgi:hypothetical protein
MHRVISSTPFTAEERASLKTVTRLASICDADASSQEDSSGVYISKSIVNNSRHGNFIYKSEVIYLRCRCKNPGRMLEWKTRHERKKRKHLEEAGCAMKVSQCF